MNKKIFDIVIVTHGNYEDLKVIFAELAESELCRIWVRDNLSQDNIRDLCNKYNVNYSPALRREGFALNNNIMVEEIVKYSNPQDVKDKNLQYLIFMNPDAFISKEYLASLSDKVIKSEPDMFTIDLYKDSSFKVRDPAVRRFPTIATFILSFLFKKNNSIIDREGLNEDSDPDWCASSFFGVKIKDYIALNGFNSRFFMYCEDVDFCYRAKRKGLILTYYHDICGIHRANHGSKNIFSRHFFWHLSSAFRYIWYRINESKK